MKRKSTRSTQRPSRRNSKKLFFALLFFLAAAIGIGIGFYMLAPQDKNRNLTEPPTDAAEIQKKQSTPSTFSLDIPVPIGTPGNETNISSISQIDGVADGPRECSNRRGARNLCYTTRYHYSITSGSATITPGADGSLNVSTSVYVSGKGSQEGRSADKAQSDIRYFQSKLTANATVTVTLDSRWCPKIHVKPSFTWKDPSRVEIFHRAKVDIQYLVERLLDDPVTTMGNKAVEKFIHCDEVRAILANAWKFNSLPISKADGRSLQYINIRPKSVNYSGLKLVSGKLFLGFRITADTEIADQPAISDIRALPQATRIMDGGGNASIPLPIDLGYQYILNAINDQIGKQPFQTKNRWGNFTIHVNKIKIYPSNEQLVLGLHVHIINSESWMDTFGWVFLQTTPQLIESGDGIMLTRPVFSKPVDTGEWVTIKRALKESVADTIKKRGLAVSFTKETRHLLNNIKHALGKSYAGYPVKFAHPVFKISSVSLLSDRITVNGALDAEASYVPDSDNKQLVAMDIQSPEAVQTSQDESKDDIQLKIDSLLNQMDTIENKLSRFRQILEN